MTSKEFVIWLKGFTEACNDYTATPKQWDRIKEVLNEVEEFDDDPGLDEEIDDWYPDANIPFRSTGTFPNYIPSNGIVFSSSSGTSGTINTTNIPNHTNITYTTKHQLND